MVEPQWGRVAAELRRGEEREKREGTQPYAEGFRQEQLWKGKNLFMTGFNNDPVLECISLGRCVNLIQSSFSGSGKLKLF